MIDLIVIVCVAVIALLLLCVSASLNIFDSVSAIVRVLHIVVW